MSKTGCMLFPVLSVKRFGVDTIKCACLDAVVIDADAIGIRARNIKRFDAAVTAEIVFRCL